MRVDGISGGVFTIASQIDSEEVVQANLRSLAEKHGVGVDELISSAKAAGYGGPEYLVRALNLSNRLEKLRNL